MSTTDDLVALRGTRTYAMGDIPPSPVYPYQVIGFAPAPPVVRTLDGSGDPESRFTVQHFGKSAASVEVEAAKTFATFDGHAVAGEVCWQETATPVYRDPDDNGVLSITHTYRY